MPQQLDLFEQTDSEDTKLDAVARRIIAEMDARGFTQRDKEDFLRRLQLSMMLRNCSHADRQRFLATALQMTVNHS